LIFQTRAQGQNPATSAEPRRSMPQT